MATTEFAKATNQATMIRVSSGCHFFWIDAAVKRRAERKSRANTEKKIATTKSLYAILSPLTKLGVTPGGGGDAATKPSSDELMLRESCVPEIPEEEKRTATGCKEHHV